MPHFLNVLLAEARALGDGTQLTDTQRDKLAKIAASWAKRSRRAGRAVPYASEILDRLLDDELAVLRAR